MPTVQWYADIKLHYASNCNLFSNAVVPPPSSMSATSSYIATKSTADTSIAFSSSMLISASSTISMPVLIPVQTVPYSWLDILINHHMHIQNATQAQEERHSKCHNKITLPAHHRDSSVRRATLADIQLA